MCKRTIGKDSVEEESFIKDIISSTKNLDVSKLLDIPLLEKAINNLAKNIDNVWTKNSKLVRRSSHWGGSLQNGLRDE